MAADGSEAETRSVIDTCRADLCLNIIHVWHHDNGFRKTKILNEALKASSVAYIIFTDGDCISRKDFIEQHINNAEEGSSCQEERLGYLCQ